MLGAQSQYVQAGFKRAQGGGSMVALTLGVLGFGKDKVCVRGRELLVDDARLLQHLQELPVVLLAVNNGKM